MPYIPSRTGFGVPPEVLQPARGPRPPIPVPQPARPEKPEPPPAQKRAALGLEKINLHTYAADPVKILTALLGPTATRNPETGEATVGPRPGGKP